MKVKIQKCWHGGDKFSFRALVCGGLLIKCEPGDDWQRKYATAMLDLLEAEGLDRSKIRFHVI